MIVAMILGWEKDACDTREKYIDSFSYSLRGRFGIFQNIVMIHADLPKS